MEVGDYINRRMNSTKIITWEGEWNQFKRLFKGTERLSGVADAIQVGELVV